MDDGQGRQQSVVDGPANAPSRSGRAWTTWALIIALFVIASALAAGLIWFESSVTVPSVTGLTPDQAKLVLQELGLVVGSVSYSEDGTGIDGAVVTQSPPARSRAKKGTALLLVVLRLPKESAAATLPPTTPAPKAAEPVPSTVRVPKLTGLTIAEAMQRICAAGLQAGEMTQVKSTAANVGRVVGQQPEAGVTVDQGNPIDFTVGYGGLGADDEAVSPEPEVPPPASPPPPVIPVNQPPVARITAEGCYRGSSVPKYFYLRLDAGGSTDDSGILTYGWTLGDGSKQELHYGRTVSRSWCGWFPTWVKLVVTDTGGLTGQATANPSYPYRNP